MWDGQLPAVICLNKADLSVNQKPMVFYCMLYRVNYLTHVLEKVKAYFDDFVAEGSREDFANMWFDFDDKPLHWEVPIGVQFDTLVGVNNKEQELPWRLNFHYSGAPEESVKLRKVGALIDMSYIKFSYINSLKESHLLRMGTAHEILAQMKKQDEEKLLSGIHKHSYETFWEINQCFCDKHIGDMRKYAVRLYSNKFGRAV